MEVHDPARFKAKAPAPPRYITLHPPAQWTPDVLVALQLSAYSPQSFFKAQSAGQELALLAIGNTFDNFLPLEADWFQVALEVVDALRAVLNGQPCVRRLHLGLSCPVALAFAIGMGLGVQPPLRVYNWFAGQRTYAPVLDLDRLRPLGASAGVVAELRAPWETKVARERLIRLRQILVEYFEEGELKILCYDLSEDYEDLPGVGKKDKAQEMVARFERHGRSAELIAAVRQQRPHVSWED
jgi:hypothetical protein